MVGKKKADYEYERRKTALRQTDLSRFGIETLWIDQFSHVPNLLETLSSFVHRNSVFLSGAYVDPTPLGPGRLHDLAVEIGRRLIDDGYNLVSGFGLGLGETSVIGALRALYGIPKGTDLNRLTVRPFTEASDGDQRTHKRRHREDLISRSGIVIVISGNRSAASGSTEKSPGVVEEVEIATRLGKFVIPVGASGHVARDLWDQAMSTPDKFLPGINSRKELKVLGDSSASNTQLVAALFSLLRKSKDAVSL